MDRTNTMIPPPPERLIVGNDEELLAKLMKARSAAENGNVLTKDEVYGSLKEKYGF